MPHMTRIPSDLARFGLRVELVPGWETRGSPSFAPACVVDHWTAGPRGTAGRPSLSVVVNGRAGLDGPLCNVYLARNGVCVVVAAGRANHAGAGGFRGLVGNSAAYGIEAESGGDGDWTPEMLDAYPRLNAALLWGLGRDASWVAGHNEWTPRKIDIRDIIGSVRARTATVLANPTTQEGNDMDANQDRMLREVHDELFKRLPNRVDQQSADTILGYSANADAQIYHVRTTDVPNVLAQIAGLTAAVKTLAAGAAGDGVDPEDLRAVIFDAMAKVVEVQVSVSGAKGDPATGPVS